MEIGAHVCMELERFGSRRNSPPMNECRGKRKKSSAEETELGVKEHMGRKSR
jgi:hypothetical protein